MNPTELTELVGELYSCQRKRTMTLKSRNMQSNRLQACVAGTLGYTSAMVDKDREAKFREATALIRQVVTEDRPNAFAEFIKASHIGLNALNKELDKCDHLLEKLATKLPVASWVSKPEQRGFGLLSLGQVVGEAGDLTAYQDQKDDKGRPIGYANPAKLWRRFGLAPYSFDGKTLMGGTWKRKVEGSLTGEAWSDFGYSPRRRSIAYILGENLIKLNGDGPYKSRYRAAKVIAYTNHPEWDWKPCATCKKKGAENCTSCCGLGKTCKRAHLHGMLLATKMLLKNLWVEWNS